MERDPRRIGVVLEALVAAWESAPQLRLGQLLLNLASDQELYNLEDDELTTRLREVVSRSMGELRVEPRIETGPVQFGDDWPGVFIRGDNAMYFATLLNQQLAGRGTALTTATLRGLVETLAACDTGRGGDETLRLGSARACLLIGRRSDA